MTKTIQFHLVNNTDMMLQAVWLRVDDTYYLAKQLAAHSDEHFQMELPDNGKDRMTVSFQDYDWGLFSTDYQKQIYVDKNELRAPVIVSIEGEPGIMPWVTTANQQGEHHQKLTTERRGAVSGITIPNGK